MAATALLRFDQTTPGVNGQAYVGLPGLPATVSNSDNTDVLSWQIDLVYTPPGSAIPVTVPYAFNDSSSTPTAVITPDVPGAYRFVLKVWNAINRVGTPTDVDIRNLVLRYPNNRLILPPYQKDPDPLPTLASALPGAKPNEMNIGGVELGWLGNGADGQLAGFISQMDGSVADISVAARRTLPVTDDLPPYLNFPGVATFDGVNVWAFKQNFFASSASQDPRGWGFARINPATNTFREDHDFGTDAPFSSQDGVTFALWTGTQLYAFGFNFGTLETWVQEILPGGPNTSAPATFGTKTVLSLGGDPVLDAVVDTVNGKIWTMGFTGILYRFPITFPGGAIVSEVSISPAASSGGLAFDPDTVTYPDGKPKLFFGDASTAIFRITDLETLSPFVDDSVALAAQKVAVHPTYLFAATSVTTNRLSKEPLSPIASDSTLVGIVPLDLLYDPFTDQLALLYDETINFSPSVALYTTAPLFSGTTNINPRSQGGTFFPRKMAHIPSQGLVYVGDITNNKLGAGEVFQFDLSTSTQTRVVSDFRPHWDLLSRIQYVTIDGDLTDTTWDGFSDVMAVNLSTFFGTTLTIGPSIYGKRLVIVDVAGTISGSGPVNFSVSSAINPPITPLTTPYGSVILIGIGQGGWAVEASQGPSFTLPAGDLGGTLGSPIVVAIQTNPVNSGTPLNTNGYLVWNGSAWNPRNFIGSPQFITGSGVWDTRADVIIVDGSGARTITFPNPSDVPKRVTVIDRAGTAGAGTISLTATAGSISGGTAAISSNFGAITIIQHSTGTNGWLIESLNPATGGGGSSFTGTVITTTPFTITTEDAVGVNRSGATTVNLPSLSAAKIITVYDWAGNADTLTPITVTPPVGQNIDGATTYRISTPFGSVQLLWTNTTLRWKILDEYKAPSIVTTSGATTNLATTNSIVLVDSLSGARTVNLPASPFPNERHTIKDRDNNAATNNITIGRNGNTIDGLTSNYVIGTNAGSVTLVWTNSTSASFGWRVV